MTAVPYYELRCTACGELPDHRLHTSGDHPFCRKSEVPDYDVAAIAADLRTQLQPMAPPTPRKTLDALARDPAVVKVRAQMAAAQVAAAEAVEGEAAT